MVSKLLLPAGRGLCAWTESDPDTGDPARRHLWPRAPSLPTAPYALAAPGLTNSPVSLHTIAFLQGALLAPR